MMKTNTSLKLSATSFEQGGDIPQIYTCDGRNISPALTWDNPPEQTRSFALIVDDPDAPGGTFTHWLLWDVPGSDRVLPEGAPQAGLEGKNDFHKAAYGGPCPPPGDEAHRYFFKLFALDMESLGLENGASRQNLEEAIEGHVLDRTELVGKYRRTR